MKALKFILFVLCIFIAVTDYAQVAITNDASLPHVSAMLDIKSNNKGLLIPRNALRSLTDELSIPNPATYLLVYNTNPLLPEGTGIYVNTGTAGSPAWSKVGSTANAWLVTGNTGTSSANFVGTLDDQHLKFKINNIPAGQLQTNGSVFLGLNTAINNFGFSNVAIGNSALHDNTAGVNNVAIGDSALYKMTSKNSYPNIAVGSKALYNNTSGNANVAIGHRSLYNNTTGVQNTASGLFALGSNTSGGFNSAYGGFALNSNTIGNGNTSVGQSSMYSNTTGNNNTAVGVSALNNNQTGRNNVAVGGVALGASINGDYNIAIGDSALGLQTIGGLYPNIAVGSKALYNNTSGNANVAIGHRSLYNNTIGAQNTASGLFALGSNTSGGFNSAYGGFALNSNTIGNGNTSVGQSSMYSNTAGNNNTAIGSSALNSSTSNDNTAVGYIAASQITTGIRNVAVGSNTLTVNTTGSFNTAVGYNTGPNAANYVNTTCLGIDATATGSNMVRIGNQFVTSIGGQVGWSTLSDGRFKENVKENVPGLNFIMLLHPVTYNLNKHKINESLRNDKAEYTNIVASSNVAQPLTVSEITTGLIAQDVETIAKNIGFDFSGVDKPKNENDYYGLRYGDFVVPLIKCVQEQQKLIEELKLEQKQTLEDFRKEIRKLRQEVESLKQK